MNEHICANTPQHICANTPHHHATSAQTRIIARWKERYPNRPHHYLYGWISEADADWDNGKPAADESKISTIEWRRSKERRWRWMENLDNCATLYVKRRKVEEPLEEREEQNCRQEIEQWRLFNAAYRLPPHVNPIEILPRGAQILAEDPYDLKLGFPYHSFLEKCDISVLGWTHFTRSILGRFEQCGGPRFHFPHANDFEIHTMAKYIEYILDNVAEQDITFFRPRGLIMRIDMPGEQEFGLDFMDLYVGRYGSRHIDQYPHNLMAPPDHESIAKSPKPELCKSCKAFTSSPQKRANNRHRNDIRQKLFNGTRIVIDPLAVLEDPNTAYKRGWTNWIKQCADAKEKKPRAPKDDEHRALGEDEPLTLPGSKEDKPYPVLKGEDDQLEYFKTLDTYFEARRTRPLSERVFRWPPSKQLFYDRWRGHTGDPVLQPRLGLAHRHAHEWVPWADSMDKRMHVQSQPQTVVPADGIGIMELHRGKSGTEHARTDKVSVRSAKALPRLQSEFKAVYLQVHKASCERRFEATRPNPKHSHHVDWPEGGGDYSHNDSGRHVWMTFETQRQQQMIYNQQR